MIESIFREPALIGYLVKSLREKFPNKRVGKTIIQKMVYLLVRLGVMDFGYSMYHYGPYSSGVSGELNFAENNDIVEMEWVEDAGYFITPGDGLERFEYLVTEDEKRQIDNTVKKYGKFNAGELSLIATALYLRDNFGVSDERLTEVVHDVKEQYPVSYIRKILEQGEIIDQIQIPF